MKKLPLSAKLVIAAVVIGAPGLLVAGTALALGQTFGFVGAMPLLVVIGAFLAGFALLLFTVGVALHVFGPAGDPVRAARNYASYPTILGALYLALLLGTLSGGLYVVVRAVVAALDSGVPLVLSSLSATLGQHVSYVDYLIVASLMQQVAFLAILYFRIVRPRVITWQDMGLNARQLPRRVLFGLAGAVAVVTALVLVEALLGLFGIRQTQADIFEPLRRASLPQFIVFWFIATLIVGFTEESFFRGYIFQALYREKGSRRAYLASAAIFATAHFDLRAVLPLFLGGLVLAAIFRRSGSIVPGIIAHAINNGVVLAVLYFHMA